MTRRRGDRYGESRTLLLAGWLFADLLLVLLVVALSALPEPKRPEITATPTPAPVPTTATPTPSPTPNPTRTAERGLVIQPCRFTLQVGYGTLAGAGAQQVADQLTNQLKAAGVDQRTAGFVLSFGHSPDVGVGQEAARKVNDIIGARLQPVFGAAPKRGYWTGDTKADEVDVDVFFLAAPNGDTSFPPLCRPSPSDR